MKDDPVAAKWRNCFTKTLRSSEDAPLLEAAAEGVRLGEWTKALTAVVVETSRACGWRSTAKGHRLEMLPVSRSEYLNLDVVAFPPGEAKWQYPKAIIELENSRDEDKIAYALWKLVCVKADLRLLFCYRESASEAPSLVQLLREDIIQSMNIHSRLRMEGETAVVVGNRGDAETFPYGYFRWWLLDTNTATFDSM